MLYQLLVADFWVEWLDDPTSGSCFSSSSQRKTRRDVQVLAAASLLFCI